MRTMLEHPVISQMERYGYTEREQEYEVDEDQEYEERKEVEIFGED